MLASIPNRGFGRGRPQLPLAIDGNYERASVNMSLSSVTGDGDSAIISIRPLGAEAESSSGGLVWREPSVRVTGALGKRPQFYFTSLSTNDSGQWSNMPSRHCMFSYNRRDWFYFTNTSLNSGADRVEFRHSTPFTQDTVYIGRGRQMDVHQHGERLDELAALYPTLLSPAPSALAFTPTGTLPADYAGQSFIAGEYSAQTNDIGLPVAKTPFYTAIVSDASLSPPSGSKQWMVIFGGVHGAEDHGDYLMYNFMTHLMGNSAEAIDLRTYYNTVWYPCVNAPGRAGGAVRGSYQDQIGSGGDDLNRHFHENQPVGLEIVDFPRSALLLDLPVPAKLHFPFHAPFAANWGYGVDGVANTETLRARTQTYFGITVSDTDNTPVGSTVYYFNNQGATLAVHIESGDANDQSEANMMNFPIAMMKAISSMRADNLL